MIHWKDHKDHNILMDIDHIIAVGTKANYRNSHIWQVFNKAYFNKMKKHYLILDDTLKKEYRIGNSYYNQKFICQVLEELLEQQILTKNQRRPLKKWQGKPIVFRYLQEPLYSTLDITPIFIRTFEGKKYYAVAPVFKED